MSGNCFTGTIPDSISNLKNIEIFYIDHNKFSGTLADGINDLQNLKRLDISNNRFSGSVNNSFGDLQAGLQYLHFENNSFSGEISPSLCDLFGVDLSFYPQRREIVPPFCLSVSGFISVFFHPILLLTHFINVLRRGHV